MRYMKNYEFMRDYLADRENLGFPHIVIVSGMTIYLTGEDTFEVKDNAVKWVLLEKWNQVGSLRMTYNDIMAVKDVTGWFEGNTDIVDFKEFRYFEGMDYVPGRCFAHCTSLRSIILPPTITTIWDMAFGNTDSLQEVVIPESVVHIKDNAFNSSGLISVTVPKNVEDIGDYVWCHCHNLREATFESVSPPKMNGGTLFSDCPNLTTVYVPGKSIDRYKRARGWSYFAEKMKPIEEK